jgi:hypothetical protein
MLEPAPHMSEVLALRGATKHFGPTAALVGVDFDLRLRDGRRVASASPAELDRDALVRAMLGRSITAERVRAPAPTRRAVGRACTRSRTSLEAAKNFPERACSCLAGFVASAKKFAFLRKLGVVPDPLPALCSRRVMGVQRSCRSRLPSNVATLAPSAGTLLLVLFAAASAAAQPAGHAQHMPGYEMQTNLTLNLTEIVTGIAASLMAFQAALAYREGRLGRGMTWVSVGMVIMAIGHIILVLQRIAHFDVLGFLGPSGSFVAFSIAVFASFISSGFGFWLIRHEADRYSALEATAARRTKADTRNKSTSMPGQ